MEVAQSETAVIFGSSANDGTFPLYFGMGSDTQTTDDTAVNEEIVIATGLELDQ